MLFSMQDKDIFINKYFMFCAINEHFPILELQVFFFEVAGSSSLDDRLSQVRICGG